MAGFLYVVQTYVLFMFFDSGDLTPVPGRGPQEPSYPIRGVVHDA